MNKLATSIAIIALLIIGYLINLWIYPETVRDIQAVAEASAVSSR